MNRVRTTLRINGTPDPITRIAPRMIRRIGRNEDELLDGSVDAFVSTVGSGAGEDSADSSVIVVDSPNTSLSVGVAFGVTEGFSVGIAVGVWAVVGTGVDVGSGVEVGVGVGFGACVGVGFGPIILVADGSDHIGPLPASVYRPSLN